MKLLLDTHAWLWALQSPNHFGPKTRRMLENTQTELWLSPISIWEAALLAEKKRLRLKSPFSDWLERALQEMPLEDAPLTRSVALTSREIEVSHEDPADRFLAATASVYELTLLTADERLLASRGFKHFDCQQ